MNELIREKLETEILNEIKELSNFQTGSDEKKAAIDNLAVLYKLGIEETKIELEAEAKRYERGITDEANERDIQLKRSQLDEQIKDRYFKIGLEAAGIVLPLMFYATWMKRGLRFEETGTFTSTTFKGLFNRFKPTQK